MRIAYLAPRIDVRSSSAEVVHVFEVAKAWKDMGHEVTIFTSRPGRPGGPMAPKFRDFPVRESLTPLSFPMADAAEVSYCYDLLRRSRESRPDLLYLRHFASTLPARFASGILGARLFVEVNGIHAVEERFLSRRYAILGGAQRFDGLGFHGAERIVAVTAQIADHLVKRYHVSPASISVVHNGANTDLFRPKLRQDCRSRVGFPPDVPIVLFVGDLARWQGVDILIRSVPKILQANPSTIFAIVGGGAALGELRALAEELDVSPHVLFAGPVAYESVPDLVGACDVAVAPRRSLRSSSSPLKLYEYMACARPVVASRIPEFQVVEDEGAGVLVEPENPERLAEAVAGLLADSGLCQTMGARGREIVEKEYSWRRVAARIAHYF